MRDIESYSEGLRDGLGIKDGWRFELLGYGVDKLLDIIRQHGKNEMHVADFTREQAIKNKCYGISQPDVLIQALEALGLIKFKEGPKKLFEADTKDGGTIKLETWPEGLVLWVNGEIVWKHWEHRYQKAVYAK